MICASHIIYLFSFYRSLRKIWYLLAILTTIFMSIFLYFIFADLYRSGLICNKILFNNNLVPTLVFILCLSISILSLSFTVAGSVWKNGSTIAYEERVINLILKLNLNFLDTIYSFYWNVFLINF